MNHTPPHIAQLIKNECDGLCLTTDGKWYGFDPHEHRWTHILMKSKIPEDYKYKSIYFKNRIMKELEKLFYEDAHITQLDMNKGLIGFTNGVFDINARNFRNGRPQDYISVSTGYEFDHEDDIEVQKDLMNFILSITNTPDELLKLLKGSLYGINFPVFLTGCGRNGKGTLMALMASTLGNYYYEPSIETIKKGKKERIDNGSFQKARMVVSSAGKEDMKKINHKLKNWDGQYALWFQTNLTNIDHEHVHLPFNFVTNPLLPNEKQCNRQIKEKFINDKRYAQQWMRILLLG